MSGAGRGRRRRRRTVVVLEEGIGDADEPALLEGDAGVVGEDAVCGGGGGTCGCGGRGVSGRARRRGARTGEEVTGIGDGLRVLGEQLVQHPGGDGEGGEVDGTCLRHRADPGRVRPPAFCSATCIPTPNARRVPRHTRRPLRPRLVSPGQPAPAPAPVPVPAPPAHPAQASNADLAALNTLAWSVWVSRGAGLALALDAALLLVPMLRNTLTVLRPQLARLLPADENVWFHRQVAYSMAFWTVVHVTAHYINFFNIELTRKSPHRATPP